ncbi:hypothetical protein HY797_02645 [Candidatus Falkowbacteria bacterium]|nr:hypothetical protein [Candidatus Falkowbacteria bacterium]
MNKNIKNQKGIILLLTLFRGRKQPWLTAVSIRLFTPAPAGILFFNQSAVILGPKDRLKALINRNKTLAKWINNKLKKE